MNFAHNQTEKAAIIAVQSILNARDTASWEKLGRLRQAVGSLSPYRALLVYGHVLLSIAERIDYYNPYRKSLSNMGQTITETMSEDYIQIVDTDTLFQVKQNPLLASNLNGIYQLMQRVADENPEMDTLTGYNRDNILILLEILIPLVKRSSEQAMGRFVNPISVLPPRDLIKSPISPKNRPLAKDVSRMIGSFSDIPKSRTKIFQNNEEFV